MKKLLVANWKLNPQTLNEAKKLFKEVSNFKIHDPRFELVICPPFSYLSSIVSHKSSVIGHRSLVKLGAQDVFWEDKGAYTGEVSAAMLKNLGVEYVIIGHSERRRWLNETDEMINKKVLTTLKAGLKVILCAGEPLNIRRKGLVAAKRFVKNQLQNDLKNVSSFKFQVPRLIVAYEPIWAIGTGRPDKPEQTAEMAKFIKDVLGAMFHVSRFPEAEPRRKASFQRGKQVRYPEGETAFSYGAGGAGKFQVLYGGSVNSGNAEMFLEKKEIDGALIGGASVKPKEFGKIIKIAQRLS